MPFPDISPVAFEIGPLVIRWYALAYVIGIVLGVRYLCWLDNHYGNSLLGTEARDDLILYGVLGIILGGRLGYVFIYNHHYYLDNLDEVLHIWQGGMSFHGGLIGVLIAFAIFAHRYRIPWLAVMDRVALGTPIGLFLGRLANFVNGELYGRVTNVSWGVVFPQGGPMARHPSQLYEAGLEGLLLGVLLWWWAVQRGALQRTGLLCGMFALGYGLARFTVEFVREPDRQLGFLALGLSMGQWLCLPMVVIGVWLIARSRNISVLPA